MPFDPSNLVGIWYTGGGWSSYNLIFRPDGLGRAEFANLHLTNVMTFRWRIVEGKLELKGIEQVELNDAQDDVVSEPWSTCVTCTVSIGSVELDNGTERHTLLLGQSFADWFPLEYVKGNPAYDVFAEPDFSWLRRRGGGN